MKAITKVVLSLVLFLGAAGGSMSGRLGDDLGQSLQKLNNGEKLTPQEIETLRLKLNAVQGNQTSLMDDLTIQTLHADRVDLNNEPGRPVIIYWYDTVNTINIPNNTWTALDFTDPKLTIKSDVIPSINFVGSKIYVNTESQQTQWFIGIHGRIGWYTNATGIRSISIAYYDSGNSLIALRTLDVRQSTGNIAGTMNGFNVTRPVPLEWPTAEGNYFQIEVWQDSGASLGIYSIDLTFTLNWK